MVFPLSFAVISPIPNSTTKPLATLLIQYFQRVQSCFRGNSNSFYTHGSSSQQYSISSSNKCARYKLGNKHSQFFGKYTTQVLRTNMYKLSRNQCSNHMHSLWRGISHYLSPRRNKENISSSYQLVKRALI